MLATLKIIHLLSLAVGLGGGVANALVGARVTAKAPEIGLPVQRLIGRLSFLALVLLWITGVWMVLDGRALGELGPWFWIKMIVVLALTAAAVTAQTAQLRGTATPARMRALGTGITGASALAVVFAVLAFS